MEMNNICSEIVMSPGFSDWVLDGNYSKKYDRINKIKRILNKI